MLDGEIALGANGRSSFGQRRFALNDPSAVASRGSRSVVLYIRSPRAAGHDLCALPLVAKSLLASTAERHRNSRTTSSVTAALYESEPAQLEHRREARPVGVRGRGALGLLAEDQAPASDAPVVVGYLPGRGARGRLGSLMLAGYRDGELVTPGTSARVSATTTSRNGAAWTRTGFRSPLQRGRPPSRAACTRGGRLRGPLPSSPPQACCGSRSSCGGFRRRTGGLLHPGRRSSRPSKRSRRPVQRSRKPPSGSR